MKTLFSWTFWGKLSILLLDAIEVRGTCQAGYDCTGRNPSVSSIIHDARPVGDRFCNIGSARSSDSDGAGTTCDNAESTALSVADLGCQAGTGTGFCREMWSIGDIMRLYSCAMCTTCPAGKYNRGMEWGRRASSTCLNCPAGKYSGSTGQASCTSCPKGHYGASVGRTTVQNACISCGVGKYNDVEGGTCKSCDIGKYSNILARTDQCATCPTGHSTARTESKSDAECEPCADGLTERNNICIYCPVGQFKPENSVGNVCTACEAGTYKYDETLNKCELCPVPKHSPTGASSCDLCAAGYLETPDLVDASNICTECDPGKTTTAIATGCVDCAVGKYTNTDTTRLLIHECNDCETGKYQEFTGKSVCMDCAKGQTSEPGAISCKDCLACTPGKFAAECRILDKNGTYSGRCEECPDCPDEGTILTDCDWRGGRLGANGSCVSTEFLTPTAYCVDEVKSNNDLYVDTEKNVIVGSSTLNAYSFMEVFGAGQNGYDGVGFVCSSICDGKQVYDSMECGGPFPCGVQACAMETSAATIRRARACPVVIDDMEDNFEIQRKQGPECEDCTECGRNLLGRDKSMDWGRGCAQECSRILCPTGEIYDWTDPDETSRGRCKACTDLTDVRLCTRTDHAKHELEKTDVSGNRARLRFKNCFPKELDKDISYGECEKCEPRANCPEGRYYARCGSGAGADVLAGELDRVCTPCNTRDGVELGGVTSSQYVDYEGATRPAYCQVFACSDPAKTGVAPLGGVCVETCKPRMCAPTETVLPCLLPHQVRCIPAYPPGPRGLGVDNDAREKQAVVPVWANMFESATSETHQFSSFENALIDLTESDAHLHVCVWNALHVTDNNMNPGGVSAAWYRAQETPGDYHVLQDTGSKFCTPILAVDAVVDRIPPAGAWQKNLSTVYPLLPLQNTVAFQSTFPRRVLVNTSASVMVYRREGAGFNGEGDSYFDPIASPEPPRRIPSPGDMFLNVDLTLSREAVVRLYVPKDRTFPSWVPGWRYGFVVRETTNSITLRNKTAIKFYGIVTNPVASD